ncbi:MAG: hypothetical protein FWF68_05805 [Spirochaetes bacterium]|nr:hypothetical protein [Spirochaetota bacterium]
MTKKRFWLGLTVVLVSLAFPFIGVSQESAPALNSSAILVYRDPAAIIPIFKMYIYIDGRIYQTTSRGLLGKVKYEDKPIALGETVTISLNDGVHSIFVKASTMESEQINFTVKQNILSFIITIENDGTGAILKLAPR